MKTYNLNGHKVVVCCDQMHVDLGDGAYYINEPILKHEWIEHFGLCLIGEEEPLLDCPHCGREVEVL